MAQKYKNIKPLVIGMGLAGSRHLQAQLDLRIETGVYTFNPDKAKSLAKQSGIIVFDNLQKAIDWSNLVHVCTPDDKHTKYVALAIEKGKTVLCEKSFTTNLQDALILQDLAHKYNSTLIVGQNYRLTPTFLETRKLVLENGIGTVTGVETSYLHDMTDYRLETKTRNTQDFLYVGGSHAVDLACWVTNQQVVSVQANVGAKIKDDYTCQERYQIILKFASGILGHVSLDASSARLVHGSDVIVEGEKGRLASHNKIDNLFLYKNGDKESASISLPNNLTFTIAQEIKIIDDFLDGKTNSYWPLPEVDEAVNIIRVLDAIQKAVSSGRSELINYK